MPDAGVEPDPFLIKTIQLEAFNRESALGVNAFFDAGVVHGIEVPSTILAL
jgi:hypothetical protein